MAETLSSIKEVSEVKMLILPNCRFNAIWIKIPESYFWGIRKLILKFIREGKRPRIAPRHWRVKSEDWQYQLNLVLSYDNQDSMMMVKGSLELHVVCEPCIFF